MSRFLIINAALFQISWWVAALYSQYAAVIIFVIIALHFWLTPTPKEDGVLLIIALLGVLSDTLQIMLGVFSTLEDTMTWWLISLWGSFTLCLNHSLRWLNSMAYWQIAILGGLFGPLSYIAAIKLGALSTTLSISEVVAIQLPCWAVLLVAMVWLNQHSQQLYRMVAEVNHE